MFVDRESVLRSKTFIKLGPMLQLSSRLANAERRWPLLSGVVNKTGLNLREMLAVLLKWHWARKETKGNNWSRNSPLHFFISSGFRREGSQEGRNLPKSDQEPPRRSESRRKSRGKCNDEHSKASSFSSQNFLT